MNEGMEDRTGRSRVVVGLTMVGILVVGLVVLVVMGLTGEDKPSTAPSMSASGQVTPSAQDSEDEESIYSAACGYEPTDRSKPDASFATTRLMTESGVRVASAQGIGPCSVNPLPTGYAFTPKGALLAAVNFVSAMTSHPDKGEVASMLLANTAGREQILASDQPQNAPVEPVAVVGFKTELVGPLEYQVDVAFSATPVADRVFAMKLPVVWEDHDWRVVMGAQGPQGYPVGDLVIEGFQVWGY